jgi:Ca-activated chloride channel family protein
MFHFQHTEYLSGLIFIPLLLLLFLGLMRWKKDRIKKIGDEKLVKELISGYAPRRFTFRFILFLLALTLVILGAANLQGPGKMEKISRKGVDVIIALDVSRSMLANDIKPNRLERAKQLINRLMQRMENDRIGLVLFAGKAYMQMPLTSDHGAAKMYIQNAGPDAVPTQGTVISDALKMAHSGFNNKDRKYKSIVLISDGEDHDPEALHYTAALAKDGIMVNTVGIGSVQGVPLFDENTRQLRRDREGNAIVSKLNEEELKQLAVQTKGVYIHLNDAEDAADQLVKQLSTISETSVSDSAFMSYKNYFQWFLGAALLLLLTEFFISEKRKLQLS